ncbi:syncytin-1-like [Falco naumanni]|uniref:syncytin-1-like n=1 Tax=Falco naumanni TaxID=148594 RepID=UPI001ADE0941|nr:syncytin-1-like [Falco naumanni]
MDCQKDQGHLYKVIPILIVTAVRILETEAWVNNTRLQTLQMIVNATKAKECWICTSLPTGGLVTPLYGVASQNWNYLDGKWPTWPDFWKKPGDGGGYCLFDDKTYELGPRFDLQILNLTTTVFMKSDNNCRWKARSKTGGACPGNPGQNTCSQSDGWNDYWINRTTVHVGNWNVDQIGNITVIDFCNSTQLQGYNPSGQDANWAYGWCKAGRFLGANLTATHGPCKLPQGYWWLCGDGFSRKQLPPGWSGMCTIGYLTTQDQIYNQTSPPPGIYRNVWRRIKRDENPIVIRNMGYHSFVRWFIPWLGVSELEKAVVNMSAEIEQMFNLTTDAINRLNQEVKSLSKVVIQNRMALDLITLKEGGVCMIINQSCCVYVDQSNQIETDINKIWNKVQILHKVSQDDT